MRFLRKFGYPGAIWPVNPRRETVAGLPCFPKPATLPGVADLAIIAIGAEAIVDMVRELQAAIAEIKGSVPDNLAIHGARAAMNATTVDFATWRDAFTKLARGDSGKRIVTETWRKVTSESSEPGRIKPIEPPSVPPPEQSPGSGE